MQYLLDEFTPHHRLLYEAIDRLDEEEDPPFLTGTVYQEYREHCETADVAAPSERRVSDFLTHLELLDLIETTRHYGSAKGKNARDHPRRLAGILHSSGAVGTAKSR